MEGFYFVKNQFQVLFHSNLDKLYEFYWMGIVYGILSTGLMLELWASLVNLW